MFVKAKRGQRGLTLIEMLVTMVILVIGIFSLVRIFPQGFRFLTHARNQTLAARLAQAEVERWKAYAANVPDGIEAEDPATGMIYTDYNPNGMGNADGMSAQDTWYWSNVNRVRMIRGEVTTIPSPTMLPYSTEGERAYSIYNLKFAPIGHPGEPANGVDHLVLIYGDPLPRLNVTELNSGEREDALEDLERQAYAIDYDDGSIFVQGTWGDREFRVEYNWWDGSRLVNHVETVSVRGSDPPSGDPIAVRLAHKPDPYSERVARKFQYVAPGNFSRRDPYEFTLLNTYNTLTFAPTIGFNPVGANRTVRTNLGPRPLRAHMDYEVMDWHVLREERTVPSPAQPGNGYALRLSVPGIKVAGRSYPGLDRVGETSGAPAMLPFSGVTPDLAGYSVVALDLTDNTLMLDSPRGANNVEGALQVDYSTGIVTIPPGVTKYTPFGQALTGQDIRGHDVRIFYQAVGDWAVQVTKAFYSYQRVAVDPSPGGWASLQYNNFAAHILAPGESLAGLGYTAPADRWTAVLVFPRKDAGHAITVSLLWNDVNDQTHEHTGDTLQLPEFAMLDQGYPYIAVPFAAQNAYRLPAGDEQWSNPNFTFVQGASLKVRTVWRENPRRWEVRDLETYINRK